MREDIRSGVRVLDLARCETLDVIDVVEDAGLVVQVVARVMRWIADHSDELSIIQAIGDGDRRCVQFCGRLSVEPEERQVDTIARLDVNDVGDRGDELFGAAVLLAEVHGGTYAAFEPGHSRPSVQEMLRNVPIGDNRLFVEHPRSADPVELRMAGQLDAAHTCDGMVDDSPVRLQALSPDLELGALEGAAAHQQRRIAVAHDNGLHSGWGKRVVLAGGQSCQRLLKTLCVANLPSFGGGCDGLD